MELEDNDGRQIHALEERHLKGRIICRDGKVKLMNEAQGFLNGVGNLV